MGPSKSRYKIKIKISAEKHSVTLVKNEYFLRGPLRLLLLFVSFSFFFFSFTFFFINHKSS